ncbi:unnamed protein product [marine sediment metagenome]|uniref:Uncharacterized protein n=1 Tax=marine sediment metagenome TaxID=412755 RepID=X1DU24_9ZZZZ
MNDVAEYWNSKKRLPKCRYMTDSRMRKLAARLKEPLFADNWKLIIDKMEASDFVTGNIIANASYYVTNKDVRSWKATIDWLLANDTNYVKVLEGKYDNKYHKVFHYIFSFIISSPVD